MPDSDRDGTTAGKLLATAHTVAGAVSLWLAQTRAGAARRSGAIMRWNRKRAQPDVDVEPDDADENGVNGAVPISPHRNAFILMGIAGGAVAAFGLAAIAGIFAPVFFALVLTICVHPLRVWLEKRGVPRGLATGSVITAVTLLLLAFGYLVLVAFGQFAELLPQFKPQIMAFGQDVAAWLSSIGITSTEISDVAKGF